MQYARQGAEESIGEMVEFLGAFGQDGSADVHCLGHGPEALVDFFGEDQGEDFAALVHGAIDTFG